MNVLGFAMRMESFRFQTKTKRKTENASHV